MYNIDNNIDISMIIDDMKRFEFRIQKGREFSVHTLPLIKNNEQYLLLNN